jgi:glutathione S-transferase
MSQPPDIEALARRYLDLWQDQASALAGDAEFARQLGRWLTLMQSGMAHAFQAAATTSAPGSQTPTAAPGDGQPRLDELARRFALLEERIARLEAGAGGKRKPAGSGTRRRKS